MRLMELTYKINTSTLKLVHDVIGEISNGSWDTSKWCPLLLFIEEFVCNKMWREFERFIEEFVCNEMWREFEINTEHCKKDLMAPIVSPWDITDNHLVCICHVWPLLSFGTFTIGPKHHLPKRNLLEELQKIIHHKIDFKCRIRFSQKEHNF